MRKWFLFVGLSLVITGCSSKEPVRAQVQRPLLEERLYQLGRISAVVNGNPLVSPAYTGDDKSRKMDKEAISSVQSMMLMDNFGILFRVRDWAPIGSATEKIKWNKRNHRIVLQSFESGRESGALEPDAIASFGYAIGWLCTDLNQQDKLDVKLETPSHSIWLVAAATVLIGEVDAKTQQRLDEDQKAVRSDSKAGANDGPVGKLFALNVEKGRKERLRRKEPLNGRWYPEDLELMKER